MSLGEPQQFLTVAFGTPIDIGFLPQTPGEPQGEVLTVAWQAKIGTSFLPYDPAEELIAGTDQAKAAVRE
jgi:hypothetical protein